MVPLIFDDRTTNCGRVNGGGTGVFVGIGVKVLVGGGKVFVAVAVGVEVSVACKDRTEIGDDPNNKASKKHPKMKILLNGIFQSP
jgi:hypothetical protein